MDLKNTINNTNIQKENIKTVATQIDNKLVELGGEQATDLSDVANKMGAMVMGNYKKVAIIKTNIQLKTKLGEFVDNIIPLNLDFTPKRIFVNFNNNYNSTIDSKKNKSSNLYSDCACIGLDEFYVYIKDITKENFKICILESKDRASFATEEIIAIG